MRYAHAAIIAGFIAVATPAQAQFMEEMEAHQMIGYAQAAVSACRTIQINPDGIMEIMSKLSASGQASVGGDRMMTEHYAKSAREHFKMLGPRACDAAMAYEKKLGIGLFIKK